MGGCSSGWWLLFGVVELGPEYSGCVCVCGLHELSRETSPGGMPVRGQPMGRPEPRVLATWVDRGPVVEMPPCPLVPQDPSVWTGGRVP